MNERVLEAKCGSCSWLWVIAYLPMSVTDVIRAGRNAVCPKCGEHKEIFVAEPRFKDDASA